MRFWRRRRYRSAGTVVSAKVHRLIAAGNRARDVGQWGHAAAHYSLALGDQPGLFHIMIQLGHALKEDGRPAEAEQVYRDAHAAWPQERDGALHLAHTQKARGLLEEAANHYVALAIGDPDDEEAMREARDLIGRLDDEHRRGLTDLLARGAAGERIDPDEGGYPSIETCSIVYDASDLMTYFSAARRPTGIQRVQLETLVHALGRTRDGSERVGVCCFIDGRDEWVAVPPAAFLNLARLSVANEGVDPAEWRRTRDRLHLWLLVTDPFEFARGAALVNLGTSWSLQNYFLHVRDAQVRRDITYIPMIYDLIPVLFPDWCLDALVQDFVAWAEGVFTHTSHFLAISEWSKRDLIATARYVGHVIDPDDVAVVPLHADFAAPSAGTDEAELPRAIGGEPFVLFVSTIEPRKGHLVAFDAWLRLIDLIGEVDVPRLVCVGRNGWRNAAVYERLAADPVLQRRVTILSDLSDATLSTLYRRSLFTIYPSLYEGWGLPVTEALCRGKVVITTTSSSLPEAGGAFATFVPPADPQTLAEEAAMLIRDPATRRAREALIVERFRPQGWNAIAGQIGEQVVALTKLAQRDPASAQQGAPSTAFIGTCYWLGRSCAMQLRPRSDVGEAFRAGLNWRAPEDWGCRIKRSGGMLAMRVDPAAIPHDRRLLVVLRLVGSERQRCRYDIVGGLEPVHGMLCRRERLSVAVNVAVPPTGLVALTITGDTAEADAADAAPGTSRAPDTVGVECFMVRPES